MDLYLPELRTPVNRIGRTNVAGQNPDDCRFLRGSVARKNSESLAEESSLQTFSSFQKEVEARYWESKGEPSQHSTHATYRSDGCFSSSSHVRPIEPTMLEKEEEEIVTKDWNCCSPLRIAIFAVHLLLVAIGFIVISKFLSSTNKASPDEQSYAIPDNHNCSTSSEQFLLVPDMDPVQGTTFGETKNYFSCDTNDQTGVWYSSIGTGAGMVALVSSQSSFRPHVSILSGPCSDTNCVGTGENLGGETTSVAWQSEIGQFYHIFVQGQSAGKFSIALTETMTTNVNCEDSLNLLLPTDGGIYSLPGETTTSWADHNFYGNSSDFNFDSSAWYSVVGNGKFLSASICGGIGSIAAEDVYLELFTGDCQGLDYASGVNRRANATTGAANAVEWVSKPGEKYILLAWTLGEPSSAFNLCLTQSEPGTSCYSSTPTNFFQDNIGRAHVQGTLQTPTKHFYNDSFVGHDSCQGGALPSSTVWYRMQGTGQSVTATTCDSGPDNVTAIFDVFVGSTCEKSQCVASGTSATCGAANGQQYLSWDSVRGQNYWIAVYGEESYGKGGIFTLDLQFGRRSIEYNETGENNIPFISQIDDKPGLVWSSIVIVTLVAIFAVVAWRWRRLKGTNCSEPPRNE
jgi:hypothetical protein